jgi:alanine-glyoxylate transaminase/serine-glyoxylate transaminase/serine-pyruvate transaminase
MLPPGLGFNVLSDKALATARPARLPKSYWDWQPMLNANAKGVFPYTPATNLLYGLRESLSILQELGLEQVFARHDRHAKATRRAVRTWGLELLCLEPRQYSSSLTAVVVPQGMNADALRATILEHYDLSLGNGLGKLAGRVFRIGHLGDFNDLMLAGTLSGIEMGLHRVGFAVAGSGVAAALDYLSGSQQADQQRASAA